MAALEQQRTSCLSTSLPDVSSEGGNLRGSHQAFVPLPPLPSTPPPVNFNMEDDRWADKMDSMTGSVFYVAPRPQDSLDDPLPRSYSSCSSLSSMTSDLPHAPSPTHSLRSETFSEKFSHGLSRGPQSLDRYSYTPEPSEEHWSEMAILPGGKKTSSLKKIKKAFKKRKGMSASQSDLNDVMGRAHHIQSLPSFSESGSISPSTPNTDLLETTLFGSGGIPLTPTHSLYGRGHRGSTMSRVTIVLSQFGLGVGLTPCSLERLGIVPARSLSKGKFGSTFSLKHPKYPSSSDISQPVLIRGIVPGSPAAVSQQFFSGDTIHFVDNHRINVDNIDTLLRGLSGKVNFFIKKGYHRPRSTTLPHPPGPSAGGLVRLVSGVKDAVRAHSHPSHPHTSLLLYLTLDTQEDDPPGSDVLYQWPRGGEEECLMTVRGVFLTLADLLREMTGSKTFCSTVSVDGQFYHVGYSKYNEELLLLTFPASKATPYQVQLLLEKISTTVELFYGTVSNAFTTIGSHWALDHLLALIFDTLNTPSSSLHPLLTVVPQLKLPPDIKVRLSVVLSGLDSADHSQRPEVLHQRRAFFVLGSSLFYKGALACSHLCEQDQRDIIHLANSYRLPELTASDSISQIVIWKQVFLSRLRVATKEHTLCYQSTFALIVGLENMFVCLLMETTAAFPSHSPPPIDALYVDRARSLILELRAQDLLSDCEEKGLPTTPIPSLTTADVALASKFSRRSSLSFAPLPLTIPLRQRKNSAPTKAPNPFLSHLNLNAIGDSSDSDDPTFIKPSPATHRRTQSLFSGKPKKSASVLDNPTPKGVVPRKPYMLTSGVDDILFHYVHLSPGRGVLICPAHSQSGTVHSELLHTFRETCFSIRQTLWGRVEEGVTCVESDSESDDWDDDEEEDIKDETSLTFSPFAPRVSNVLEHGVLIQCGIQNTEKQKNSPLLNYWVVGRLLGEGVNRTELYVCYHDSVSQDSVEMAYRLLFGWTS